MRKRNDLTHKKLPKTDAETGWRITGPYIDKTGKKTPQTYIILTDENGKQHKRGLRKYMRQLEKGVTVKIGFEEPKSMLQKIVDFIKKLFSK